MENYQSTIPWVNVKSDWFGFNDDSKYKVMGKAEAFNMYLQLFKYRIHRGSYDEHLFYTSLNELRKHTRMGYSERLTFNQVRALLIKMESVGVINLENGSLDSVDGDQLLKLKAIDVPISATDDKEGDYYIGIDFKMVDYIYNNLGLNAFQQSLYWLLYRLSMGSESKATMMINNMAKVMGCSTNTITSGLQTLNRVGLIASRQRMRDAGFGIRLEHNVCKRVEDIDEFKEVYGDMQQKFLDRYK